MQAPRRSVPKRLDISTDAFGGWIFLNNYDSEAEIQGEFITIGTDSLYIMVDGQVLAHDLDDIDKARVVLFNTNNSAYAIWTFLGFISTISNGYFLVFTGPMWLITGAAVNSGEAKRINYFDYPSYDWEELIKYARFPQGFPEGINLMDLRPRT